jgi:hypothetical protein
VLGAKSFTPLLELRKYLILLIIKKNNLFGFGLTHAILLYLAYCLNIPTILVLLYSLQRTLFITLSRPSAIISQQTFTFVSYFAHLPSSSFWEKESCSTRLWLRLSHI